MTDTSTIDASSEEVPRSTALAVVPEHTVTVAHRQSPGELAIQAQELREVMKAVLIEGTDYGKIPGVARPSLFKSGAEWLLKWAGYGHKLEPVDVERTPDGRKFGVTYRATVHLLQNPECVVSTCDGYAGYDEDRFFKSAAALEAQERANASKYQRPAKPEKWAEEYRAPWNSVLKMAEKRAMVGAALQACAASGLFTQDMEDVAPAAAPAAPPAAPASEADKDELRRRIASLPAEAQLALKPLWVDALPSLARLTEPLVGAARSLVASMEARAKGGEWGDWAPPADPSTGEVPPDAPAPAAESPQDAETGPEATGTAGTDQERSDGDDGASGGESGQPSLLGDDTDDNTVMDLVGEEHTNVTVALVKAMPVGKVDDALVARGEPVDGNTDARRRRLVMAMLRETVAQRQAS